MAIMLGTAVVRILKTWLSDPEETNQGISIIKEQESSDVKSIEAKINRLEKAAGADGVNALPVEERFSSSIILGDYTAKDFDEFEVLEAASVIANANATASGSEVLIDRAKRAKPQNLFVVIGRNDIVELKGDTAEFEASYREMLTEITDAFSKTYIYACGILPVKKSVLEEESSYKKIADYNKIIKDLCEEFEITYIDVSDLPTNADYEGDGIHFNMEFYEMWAEYLAEEAAL